MGGWGGGLHQRAAVRGEKDGRERKRGAVIPFSSAHRVLSTVLSPCWWCVVPGVPPACPPPSRFLVSFSRQFGTDLSSAAAISSFTVIVFSTPFASFQLVSSAVFPSAPWCFDTLACCERSPCFPPPDTNTSPPNSHTEINDWARHNARPYFQIVAGFGWASRNPGESLLDTDTARHEAAPAPSLSFLFLSLSLSAVSSISLFRALLFRSCPVPRPPRSVLCFWSWGVAV